MGDLGRQAEFADICKQYTLYKEEDAEDHHKGDGIVCVFFPEEDYPQ